MKALRIAAIALGVLGLAGASYLWNRSLSHDLAHDSPKASTASPAPSAEGTQSRDAATRHMPPWHHGLIHGTKGDDVLYGTESGERIEALAGRDTIIARGGDDILDGGSDADVLMGGLGDDTYILEHHGGGADIIIEEGGTETLQLLGGRIELASIEILRHGDDLLLRWDHDRPSDAVIVRSWFAAAKFRVERLQFPDGSVVALEPLAASGREATSEDVIHFAPITPTALSMR